MADGWISKHQGKYWKSKNYLNLTSIHMTRVNAYVT